MRDFHPIYAICVEQIFFFLINRGFGWGGDVREVQKERDICIPMADSC